MSGELDEGREGARDTLKKRGPAGGEGKRGGLGTFSPCWENHKQAREAGSQEKVAGHKSWREIQSQIT